MRILFIPLLAAAVVSTWAAEQPKTAVPNLPGNLSIPAQLKTTIKAEKAHVGDPVQFKTVEAVLVSKGLIMPANTKLYGHVLGAAPRRGETPSYISVIVERAEWKAHSLPLHAFIFGHISSMVPLDTGIDPASEENASQRNAPNAIVPGRRVNLGDPQQAIALGRAQDAAAWNREANMQAAFLMDVKLSRLKSGATFLFSEKHNLKLAGGILFLLQNVPLVDAMNKATTAPASK